MIIETSAGRVSGSAALRDGVTVFRGIRYAAPITRENRFRPPRKPHSFDRIKECKVAGPACPQLPWTVAPILAPFAVTEAQDEDCLTLNVWTRGPRSPGRPVMVWLHGGGFAHWDGNAPVYDGSGLAATGRVVVVSINHRLNVFGFLCLTQLGTRDFVDCANAGFADIVQALQWIRDNIASFGGDPGRITLFGESGGSAKVATLLAMPAAEGLFHRAIMQSGALVRAVTPERATAAAHALLDSLALSDPHDLILVSTAQLLDALARVAPLHARAFGPVIDAATLPQHPCEPNAPITGAEVPLLIGSNADETRNMFGDPKQLDLGWTGIEAAIAPFSGTASPAEIVAAFRHNRPADDASVVFFAITNAIFFRMNIEATADRKSLQSAAVWRYELGWATPVDGGKWGAPHTLDIPLVFGTLQEAKVLVGDNDGAHAVSAQMQAAWLAFAESGSPNSPALPSWPRYETASRATMRFGLPPELTYDPYADERRALAGVPLMSLTD